MITDEQTMLVIKLANKQKEETGKLNFRAISAKLWQKYNETYPAKLLERLYWTENENPIYKPKQIKKPYLDISKG